MTDRRPRSVPIIFQLEKFVWFLCSLRKAAGEAMGKAMNAMGMDGDGSGQ